MIFTENIQQLNLPEIGPLIENAPVFPRRTNTEFIEVISRDRLKMRVWERGSGETMACGTGACASLVAAVLNGLTERKVTIQLLGGELEIEWKETDGHGIDGVLAKIFDYPLEQRDVERGENRLFTVEMALDAYFLRCPVGNILHGILYGVVQVHRLQIGCRSNFGKPFGNDP